MAIATHYLLLPPKSLQISSNLKNPRKKIRPPIFISTNPSHINPHHLRDLFSSSNYSCHTFPNFDSDRRVEPVDLNKLRIALSHSFIVVSVFCKRGFVSSGASPEEEEMKRQKLVVFDELLERAIPVTESNGQLVGFGRAVSDTGLTASIHDVVVFPALRGLGIGRLIIKRIIRLLTNKDIYDISALSTEKERLFFEACGFEDDVLESTTMMYTRAPLSDDAKTKADEIKSAGRKLLLVPPSSVLFASKKSIIPEH